MKRFFAFILGAGLLLSLFNSCRVEESNKTPEAAASVKMFSSWNRAYASFKGEFMDVAFQFNHWLQQSDSLPGATCMDYVVQRADVENTWKLMRDNQPVYLVETDGNLLDASAHWTITRCKGHMANYDMVSDYQFYANGYDNFGRTDVLQHASFIQDNTRMDIQTVGSNQWRVQLITPEAWDDYGAVYADLTLTVPSTDVPEKLSEVEYALEGSGSFAFVEDFYFNMFEEEIRTYAYLGFQIEEPLMSGGDNTPFWKGGAFKMRATNANGDVTERTAHLSVRGDNYWVCFFVNENPDDGETWCRQDCY